MAGNAVLRDGESIEPLRQGQMLLPVVGGFPDVQPLPDASLHIVRPAIQKMDRFVVVIPGHVADVLAGHLPKKLAFFVALGVLPRILDHERGGRTSFRVGLPTRRCPSSDTGRP